MLTPKSDFRQRSRQAISNIADKADGHRIVSPETDEAHQPFMAAKVLSIKDEACGSMSISLGEYSGLVVSFTMMN